MNIFVLYVKERKKIAIDARGQVEYGLFEKVKLPDMFE